MNYFKKTVLPGVIIFCMVLAMGACSPDPDPISPTETIVIKGIPAKIGEEDTFKVYVQLSAGTTAAGGYSALGTAKETNLVLEADGTLTATINNLAGPGWTGTNWANECVVIRPLAVGSKEDIIVRVGRSGPSTSSTVTFNWVGSLLPVTPGGGGLISVADYQLLYDDIVAGDTDDPITG